MNNTINKQYAAQIAVFIGFWLSAVTIGKTQGVGIGTDNPAGSAILEIASADKGIVIPRMDSLGITLITNPIQGLMVYQIDKRQGFYYYTGVGWRRVGDDWLESQGTLTTHHNVGIGTTTPDNSFQIVGGINATLNPGTGYMTIGSIPNTNMVIDNNEIQVRSNTAAANLRLQDYGGKVGIGGSPGAKVHILEGVEADLSDGSGFLGIGNVNGPNIVMDSNEIQARNNGGSGNLYLQNHGGNVYIDNPSATLYVRGTEDISLTDDEGLAVLGPTTGINIAIDNNEIMARNNGNRSTLHIQNEGGNTHIGGNLKVDSLIQGRTVFEEDIVILSGANPNLEIGEFTYVNVIADEDPTPVVNYISGFATVGRILILQNHDSFTDWILEENPFLNLSSATITMNGKDVIFLISNGIAYHQIAYSSN